MIRRLLIDADVLLYKAACSVEKAFEWEPGQWTYQADEYEAREAVDREIEHIMNALEGDTYTLAITHEVNFRKAILPTYKANRKTTRKPLVLSALRAWLIVDRHAMIRRGLEGDDVLGILATREQLPAFPPYEERIIVSIDKDMKTIPGRYSSDLKEIVEVSEAAADWFHMYQTLIGDTTDGYTGLPGVGNVKARGILMTDEPLWSAVVKAYEKRGLTEADALVQARVARILRARDYDFKRKEPILWSP